MDLRDQLSLTIEKEGEGRTRCSCCGRDSRWVAGFLYDRGYAVAAYWIHWTVDHPDDHGATLDMAVGPWGEETSAADRVAASFVHRKTSNLKAGWVVDDAEGRPVADGTVAKLVLRREDVADTELFKRLLAFVDAICEQDDRFF